MFSFKSTRGTPCRSNSFVFSKATRSTLFRLSIRLRACESASMLSTLICSMISNSREADGAPYFLPLQEDLQTTNHGIHRRYWYNITGLFSYIKNELQTLKSSLPCILEPLYFASSLCILGLIVRAECGSGSGRAMRLRRSVREVGREGSALCIVGVLSTTTPMHAIWS